MTNKTFASAVNCIDGRAQIPVIEWLIGRYGVDYVDMITEPGPERLLAEGNDVMAIELVRKKVEISVTRHDSGLVAIAGHRDCAGNPVDKETQLNQISIAVKTLKSWNIGVEIIGLQVDENWEVHEVK